MGGMAGMERVGVGNGKVFISHAHEDNARCAPLLAALRRWGVDYWFDTESITGGQDLSQGIQTAIAARDVLLRICTPAAQRSYWVRLETGAFRALQAQEHHNGRDQRLLVNVILDAGYRREPFDLASLYIDATNQPEAAWLEELRRALGIAAPAAPESPVMEAAPVVAVPPHEATTGDDTPASRARLPARPRGTTRASARADGQAPAPWLAWRQRAPARRAGLLAAVSAVLLLAAFVGLLALHGELPESNPGGAGKGTPSATRQTTPTPSPNVAATATALVKRPYTAVRPGDTCDTEQHTGGTARWISLPGSTVECLTGATRIHATPQQPGGMFDFQPSFGQLFFANDYAFSVDAQFGTPTQNYVCAELGILSYTGATDALSSYTFNVCPDGQWDVLLSDATTTRPNSPVRTGTWDTHGPFTMTITKAGATRTFAIDHRQVAQITNSPFPTTAYLEVGFGLEADIGSWCFGSQSCEADYTATFSNWDYEPAS